MFHMELHLSTLLSHILSYFKRDDGSKWRKFHTTLYVLKQIK